MRNLANIIITIVVLPAACAILAWYALSDVTIYGLEGFFNDPPREDFTP